MKKKVCKYIVLFLQWASLIVIMDTLRTILEMSQ